MDRLYIVVSGELNNGQKAVQACHALRAFVEDHPDIDQRWYQESNTIVILEAPDEQAVIELWEKMRRSGIECSMFREPDLDDVMTAIAIAPRGHRHLRNLPLAYAPLA